MKTWWADHGTKILGAVVAGVAAMQLCDAQLQILLSPKGHALFQLVSSVMLAALGALTIKRGFTNGAPSPNTHDDGTAGESQ